MRLCTLFLIDNDKGIVTAKELISMARMNHLCTLIVFSLLAIMANNQPIPPGVSTQPATQTVVEGNNATFRCVIYNNTDYVLAAIAWERMDSDGRVYHILTGPRYYYLMNTQVLTITNISIDDAGVYYCVAYRWNPDSEERGNHSTLHVIEQAVIDLSDHHIEAIIGYNVSIDAVVRGGSLITLQKKNKETGEYETLHRDKYSVLNSTITIYSLLAEDKGEYRACITNSMILSNTACTNFTIVVTGFPFISLVPLISIRNGSSCAIVCYVTGPSTEDLQMTWQRVDGLPLVGQVTKLSNTQLQLYIARVTNSVHYQCMAKNSLGINVVITKIDVTSCIPDPPLITSLSCSNDSVYITWSSGEANNDLPIDFIIEVNKVIHRVPPGTNILEVYGCKDSDVSVTAENSCGRSIPAVATIYTSTLDRSPSTTDDNRHIGNDQAIIIGLAAIFVLTTGILTILILISWRRISLLKRELD